MFEIVASKKNAMRNNSVSHYFAWHGTAVLEACNERPAALVTKCNHSNLLPRPYLGIRR